MLIHKFRLSLILFFCASTTWLQAQETNSDLRLRRQDVSPAADTAAPSGDDIDQLITNRKMRADTGSKSKYSMSSSLSYSGGSLSQPFGESKPNITGASGTTNFTTLGGSVSGKYNVTKQSSVFAGIGFRWVAPFNGERKPKNYQGNRLDVDTPYVYYQYLYRWGDLQSSIQLRESWTTASDLVRKGYVTNWGLSQSSMYDLGDSGFTVGFSAYIGIGYFNKDDYKAEQSDYSWSLTPMLEYRLNDKMNLHLDTGLFVYEHMRSYANGWKFHRQDVSQNLSLGYAIARDIFISPGVSFVVAKPSLARTTWSVGASLNFF